MVASSFSICTWYYNYYSINSYFFISKYSDEDFKHNVVITLKFGLSSHRELNLDFSDYKNK